MFINSNFLLNKKINRSGIIPFTFKDGRCYLLLAQDMKTGEYGDFGGGSKLHENALQAAKREFEEESRGIFKSKFPHLSSYLEKVSIINKDETMAITFLYVDNWTDYIDEFRNQRSDGEISNIKWIEWVIFCQLINNRFVKNMKLWSKFQGFFKNIVYKF